MQSQLEQKQTDLAAERQLYSDFKHHQSIKSLEAYHEHTKLKTQHVLSQNMIMIHKIQEREAQKKEFEKMSSLEVLPYMDN